jgi:hypothetical protein
MNEILSAFTHPGALWLAIPVLFVMVWDLVRRWGDRPGRRIFAAAVRTLALVALVVAIADPKWHRRDDVSHVVFVVDRSASIPDEALASAMERVEALRSDLPPEAEAGLVLFDTEPELVVLPGATWAVPSPLRAAPKDGSDIDGAVALALSLVPEGDAGEVVLLTDGRASGGALGLDARTLAESRRVPIHTIVVRARRRAARSSSSVGIPRRRAS